MQKKSQDFSMQEALRLMKTPAGQQLMEMVKGIDSTKFKQAADQASAGNYGIAQETLKDFLSREDVQKLLKQLGG